MVRAADSGQIGHVRPPSSRLRWIVSVSVIALVVGGGVGACSAMLGQPQSAATSGSSAQTDPRLGAKTVPSRSPSQRTPPPSSPTNKALRTFTVVASGDVLLHTGLWDQAHRDALASGQSGYNFAPLLAGVRKAVSGADLAICHMETPLAPPSGPFSSYPVFSV